MGRVVEDDDSICLLLSHPFLLLNLFLRSEIQSEEYCLKSNFKWLFDILKSLSYLSMNRAVLDVSPNFKGSALLAIFASYEKVS